MKTKAEISSRSWWVGFVSRFIFAVAACHIMTVILNPLHACCMSATICVGGSGLEELQPNGPPSDYSDYDDPWDYLALVMDNSTSYSNDDGYGVVAYKDGTYVLSGKDAWYKRVYGSGDFGNIFYTGEYPDQGYFHHPWEPDTLDIAMRDLLNRERRTGMILCHARNASRPNIGNHPFLFTHRGRTYSFMHNGFCDVARAAMIGRINVMNPGENWFSVHPSDHFAKTDPDEWVDSEILFHYIINHVISNEGNTLAGLRQALAGISGYLENFRTGVFNFIMSDGERIYVFRNTPHYGTNAHYKLSYKIVKDQFCGIRTGVPQLGDVQLDPLELVVFSQEVKPRHYPDFLYQVLDTGSPNSVGSATRQESPGQNNFPGILIRPNPFGLSATLSVKVPSACVVRFSIFNIKCELIWEKVMEFNGPATASVVWNASDRAGKRVSAGVYLVKVSLDGKVYHSRIALIS